MLFIVYVCFVPFLWGGRGRYSIKGQLSHYRVWMGRRLDGGSRGGGGMSRELGSCLPLTPPPFCPSISRGLITSSRQAQTALQNQTEEHLFDEGPWNGSRYACEDFLVFECVAVWECSPVQLKKSLT